MRKFPRIVKSSHIAKTSDFFVRYGGKTIILARFVPIVRTFAPFVAGSGEMCYRRFMLFNVIGALLWVGLILPAGWFFGNIPIVKKNFELVVLGIIFISVLPIIIEVVRANRLFHARLMSSQTSGYVCPTEILWKSRAVPLV